MPHNMMDESIRFALKRSFCLSLFMRFDGKQNILRGFRSIVAGLTVGLLLVSCSTGDQCDDKEKVLKRSEALFEEYLRQDLSGARNALQEEISLLETTTAAIDPHEMAFLLFSECARLHTLERLSGNSTSADIALIKVRYWNLRRYELKGPLTNERYEEYLSFDSERLVKMVLEADKKKTDGAGAKYFQKLSADVQNAQGK